MRTGTAGSGVKSEPSPDADGDADQQVSGLEDGVRERILPPSGADGKRHRRPLTVPLVGLPEHGAQVVHRSN